MAASIILTLSLLCFLQFKLNQTRNSSDIHLPQSKLWAEIISFIDVQGIRLSPRPLQALVKYSSFLIGREVSPLISHWLQSYRWLRVR